jgi:cysteine desulfurase
MESLYFDHAATTYVKDEVLDAMMPYFSEKFGNCSSIHGYGRQAKKALDQARKTIADAIGAKPEEVYFTSGGSESDNWAIKGVAFEKMEKGKHIITTQIEHHAVLDTCEYLKKFGFEITQLEVDEDGLISTQDLEDAIRQDTILISIMYANNEIGTIQPIDKAAKIAKKHDILFHTDAVQYIGQGKVDLANADIDLLSISGHKLYAPNGIGALYIKEGVELDNLIHGGAQERVRRAGTENLASIVGFAKAIEIAYRDFDIENPRIIKMRDRLIDTVLDELDGVKLNGHRDKRLANNVNFSFKDIDGEAILINLDLMGTCCSTGSACTSACTGPSHVLQALGLEHRWSNGSVRLTLGAKTTEADVDTVIAYINDTIKRLKLITF